MEVMRDGNEIEAVAHRLPCVVHYSGEAPTARSFLPLPDDIKSFRGRDLRSIHFDIPPQFQGESRRDVQWTSSLLS